VIYLIGSLRNEAVPKIANVLREHGHEVFDQWYGAGPNADDCWQAYCKNKGFNYKEALADHGAQHVYKFDRTFLDSSDTVVLCLPAGKSGHLELGYALGAGKRGFILLDGEPDRYDVMYNFATGVVFSIEELLSALQS
jgi:nucleoside 2-deoxyribosyltransferase